MNFYPLEIIDKIQESKDAVSLVFKAEPTHPLLDFQAGQYVTIKFDYNKSELLRCYSYSSQPGQSSFSITIKKVKKGRVSSALCDEYKIGDKVMLAGPHGKFTIKSDYSARRVFYFFAAGSGITPIYSLIQYILEHEPKSIVNLLYGNRQEEDIIFKTQLDRLSNTYSDQLFVEHVLSKPEGNALLSMFKGSLKKWTGLKGRIDHKHIEKFLENHPANKLLSNYFLCGPGSFIQNTEKILTNLGIDRNQVHREFFNLEKEKDSYDNNTSFVYAKLKAKLDGKIIEIEMNPGEKIIDALLRNKQSPPFSCSSGACATCIAKLISGKVKMDVSMALEPHEIDEGYILTCQSRALTEEVEIIFE